MEAESGTKVLGGHMHAVKFTGWVAGAMYSCLLICLAVAGKKLVQHCVDMAKTCMHLGFAAFKLSS